MKRILIVDDSPVIRSVIRIFLEQMRYGFVEAGNSMDALQALERERVDLAIIESAMPVTSGLALIERMRADARPEVRHLPIVLLTTDRSRETVQRAEAAGATAVLCKPLSSAGLLSLVRNLAPAELARA
jgi:two-component system chemotaxis response regulator CheY